MPLLVYEGRWHLLFTHRSEKLMEHRGQVSFPGGAKEKSDPNMVFTALRETREEIGVAPKDVTVYGDLGIMPIITGYLVTLVWAIPCLSSETNQMRLKVLYLPAALAGRPGPSHDQVSEFAGREFPIIYFDQYENYQLWGATAQMTINLMEALGVI